MLHLKQREKSMVKWGKNRQSEFMWETIFEWRIKTLRWFTSLSPRHWSGNHLWYRSAPMPNLCALRSVTCQSVFTRQKTTDRPQYQLWQMIISYEWCFHLQRVTSKRCSSEMTRIIATIWRRAMQPEGSLWQNVNVLCYICMCTVCHSILPYTACYCNVYDALAVNVSTY